MLEEQYTQEQIKQMNRAKIINLIRSAKEITKYDISKTLSLSIPTVTNNIMELIEDGLVEEAGVAASTGGRKPVIIRFLETSKYSVGVNITPKSVQILLIDLNCDEVDALELSYKQGVEFSELLNLVEQQIIELLNKHHIDKNKLLGIGFALPGVVDDQKKMLWDAPNIHVHNYCFSDYELRLGTKLLIENEANIAAFAEKKLGKLEGINNLVYISITEGIGTGIIIQDHIYKGTQKKAGEFGHHRISNENRKCNCGRTDCWEVYASKNALLRYYQEGSSIKLDHISEVFEAYNHQNPIAKKALEKYIAQLLIGIENIILGMNPDCVVIGGELSEYKTEMVSLLEIQVNEEHHFIDFEGSKIIFSELKSKGALIGAALLPLEEVFNYKKNIM